MPPPPKNTHLSLKIEEYTKIGLIRTITQPPTKATVPPITAAKFKPLLKVNKLNTTIRGRTFWTVIKIKNMPQATPFERSTIQRCRGAMASFKNKETPLKISQVRCGQIENNRLLVIKKEDPTL